MNTGIGIRDSGFGGAACGGPRLQTSNAIGCCGRGFHTKPRFADKVVDSFRNPVFNSQTVGHPESRIPEFNA